MRRFSVDTAAFTRWVAGQEDEFDTIALPNLSEGAAGAALSDLIHQAVEAAVIVGDPGLALVVHGDDDCEGSGFYVLLSNRGGRADLLQLTGGWRRLWSHPEQTADHQRALDYLSAVCGEANTLLDSLPRA